MIFMLKSENFPLHSSSVDRVSESVVQFLNDAGISSETITRNRLFAEELLLGWLDAGISDSFTLSMGYRLKKPCIILECEGRRFNVLEQGDEYGSVLMKNLLSTIGHYPAYSYRNGKNIIQMTFRQEKRNKLVGIALALIFAIVTSLFLKTFFSPEACAAFLSDVLDPLYSAAFRVLSFISGPLIFLSVMWGIYGIGDASTLSQVGKKMILMFLAVDFTVAITSGATFPLFDFELNSATGGSSSFKAIFEMILDIIPPNISEPFSSGNTLHLIFCAAIFGIAMLYLGKRVSTVADVLEEVNAIVQLIMTNLSELMPGFIFLVMLRIILNGNLAVFSSVWQMFLIFAAALLIICTVLTAVTSLRQKISPLIIMKKSAATFAISITTASSAAAFPSVVETCEKKFGIDENLTAFGVPLGMVMYKAATAAYYVLMSFFFAKQFSVNVSPDWIVSAVIVSAMLAIATPPIPGGAVAAYTMLFMRLGIPEDALAIVLSMDFLFDFVRTSANMYCLPLSLVNLSSKLAKLKPEVLHEK